jgi:hypothetical protein
MSKGFNKSLRFWAAFSVLAFGQPALASIRIFCIDPTPPPKCCELICDSVGSGAFYEWDVTGWGTIDQVVTDTNRNYFHCTHTTGSADVFVWSGPQFGQQHINC